MVRISALVFSILASSLHLAVNAASVITENTQPSQYQWDTLTTGKAVYIDRKYTYTKVPSAYAGADVLRTANNDKGATGNSFVKFAVNQPVSVLVAHDARISDKPGWLRGWSATGENLVTSDATLALFRKDFSAGTVTLGGNGGPSASSMYTLLVAAADAPEEPKTPDDVPQEPKPAIPVSTAPLKLANTAPERYQWDTLATGKAVYIDRKYAYTKVPSAYAGADVLRTANNDKGATGNSFVKFAVNQPVSVLVAHDARISDKPGWLRGWSATGENLVTSDATLALFRKDFSAGTVTLGGNGGPSTSSMYTLLVAAVDAPEEPKTPDDVPQEPKQASTPQGTAVTVRVSGGDQPASLRIVSSPGHGHAVVNDDGTITYHPEGDYIGNDIVHYEVKSPDGNITLSSLGITVACDDCTSDINGSQEPALTLSGPPAGVTGETLQFSATGINCTPEASGWAWTATGGSPDIGSSESFSTSYNDTGSKRVSVSNTACGGAAGFITIRIAQAQRTVGTELPPCDVHIKPGESLSKANGSGHVFCAHPGVYSGVRLTTSGTANKPKVLRYYDPANPDWKGNPVNLHKSKWVKVISQLDVVGRHWTIYGISFTRDTPNEKRRLALRGNGSVADSVLVEHGGGGGGMVRLESDTTLKKSVIRRTYINSADEHCILIGGESDNVTIIDNEIYSCDGNQIQIHPGTSNNILIQNNDFWDETSYGLKKPESSLGIKNNTGNTITAGVRVYQNRVGFGRNPSGNRPLMNPAQGMVGHFYFKENIFFGVSGGQSTSAYKTGGPATPSRSSFHGNLIWDMDGGFGFRHTDKFEAYYNTIVGVSGKWIYDSGGGKATDTDVLCNVIIDAKNYDPLGSGTVADYNAYYNSGQYASPGTHDIVRSVSSAAKNAAFCFDFKQITGPTRFCIPNARTTSASPHAKQCSGLRVGARKGIGVNDALLTHDASGIYMSESLHRVADGK